MKSPFRRFLTFAVWWELSFASAMLVGSVSLLSRVYGPAFPQFSLAFQAGDENS